MSRLLDAAIAGLSIADAAEVAAIEETLCQTWPKCQGETPSPAHLWRARGFDSEDVERWLELGVYSADAADELRRAEVPRQVLLGEWSDGITWGRAFCERLVSLKEIDDAA